MKLVIADDHKGLQAAARRVFNATDHRCRLHSMRNALSQAFAKQRTAVAAMPKTMFAQETEAEAIIRLVGALMPETKDEWAVARRGMPLETLARAAGNPTVWLPAVAI